MTERIALMSIRPATLDDVPAILALEQAAPSAAHWSSEQYKCRVHDGYIFVAERSGKIGGFLCARVVRDEWEIENVMVDQEIRRHGVGAELMRALLEKWEQRAGTTVLLEVRESNLPARALYTKYGLSEVGRRRAYYREPIEDAVLYARHRPI
jgi:[ribosomal protein S18]-alanine N-acetyltransferase